MLYHLAYFGIMLADTGATIQSFTYCNHALSLTQSLCHRGIINMAACWVAAFPTGSPIVPQSEVWWRGDASMNRTIRKRLQHFPTITFEDLPSIVLAHSRFLTLFQ